MTGKLGAVRAVPKPSSGALETALALVQGFGQGDGELAALLTEVRNAQVVNERLVAQAQNTIAEADQRLAAAGGAEQRVTEAHEEMRRHEAQAQADADQRAAELAARAVRLDEREAALSRTAATLAEREQAADKTAVELAQARQELTTQREAVDAASAEVEALRADLAARIQQIRDFAARIAD
ncbi:MAG: hypothetical protein ACPGVG_13390 [Mycobacterium sp.]